MEVINKRCCGLDVHKESVVACLMIREGGKVHKEVRTFLTMTLDLVVLHDWLKAHQVTHVAMESTGIYWRPVFNLLEEDFTVLLVNAAHIKTVPGRKTDVKDCEWIADLLSHGLLRGSFIPPEPIRDLRDLTRYRKSLTDERVREVNRLQKFLEAANIKLSSVANDVMGASGRAMLEALTAGSTDPQVLSELAKGRLRKKLPELRKALEGRFRPHHRFMVGEILTHIDFLDEAIERISQEVSCRILPFSKTVEVMDLVPGINQRVAEGVLSEMGVDMSYFSTDGHAASWAGLCPGNNESAGKRKSGKTRKGDRWLRRYLIEAAWAATRKKGSYLSALYHRLVVRRGKKKAIVAVAHRLLVIIYHMLKDQGSYRELGSDHFNKVNAAHVQRHHVRRLESLGFKVILEPLAKAA
ncbi:MAG: IS110 family transposase [Deltaproteobacteria bacterium]|nr:IS110 family transposase [Deltaproteobacteria bacterium]